MSEVLAVLLTWTAMSIGTILMGSPAGILARHRVGTLGALRVALWIGTATMTAVLLVANLFIPLGGIPAVEVVGLVMAAMVIGSAAMLVRQARSWARKPLDLLRRPAWWAMAAIAALALLLILFAGGVGGPVTNYDSGLYHLNAIQFSAGYPTIPGLANMQDRFGTNVSAFELAAFMTNSPWGAEAFRLLVGMFVTLFGVDTALRLIERRASARTAPGLFVMLLAFGLFGPFLLANADYWVTSPSPDTIAMLVTIVSGAYLVDAVRYRNGIWGTVALVMAVLAATVRTQLWLMAALTAVALAASWWLAGRAEHRSRGRLRLLTWLGLALSAVLLVAMLARDAVISGWLLYPANLLPLPVSWRAADPTVAADWVQSWARDPSSTPDQTLGNWGWLPEWAGRTLDDWSVRGSMALLALVLVVVLVARRPVQADGAATRPPLTPRFVGPWDVALVLLPCVGTVLAWFILAPDPRFAWGAIALLGLLPAALALASMNVRLVVRTTRLPADALAAVVAGFMCATLVPPAVAGLVQGSQVADAEVRTYAFGPFEVTADVSPVPVPEVTREFLSSGQVLEQPVETDQCWMVFPLCRPYADHTTRFVGVTIADGLVSG